jgi:hypothetical protein
MRFIIMHKTNAHWESGALPGAALIARVGAMLGELASTGVLLAAEGLRESAAGVRLRFHGGARTVIPGPFEPGQELPAAFSIVRVVSLDAAIEWASRLAAIEGDTEIDIRPVREPWELGMTPPPAPGSPQRFMVLRKATAATEAGIATSEGIRSRLAQLIDETTRTGTHIVSETLQPSARGRRYTNTKDGISYFDGPFVETKELIAGYITVAAESLDDAGRWALRYIEAVGAQEVDVRELQ